MQQKLDSFTLALARAKRWRRSLAPRACLRRQVAVEAAPGQADDCRAGERAGLPRIEQPCAERGTKLVATCRAARLQTTGSAHEP